MKKRGGLEIFTFYLRASKRGSAHFEMIMAFVFFVGFTLFLFVSLQPRSDNTLFDSVIDNMKIDFFDANKVEFGSIFIAVDYDKEQSCFSLDLSPDLFDFSYSGKNSIVSDLGGNILESDFNSGGVSVVSGEDFFRVKLSEEFSEGGWSGCVEANSYEIGSVIERDLVSYSKLLEMKDRYYNDYEGLQRDLDIPAIFDFGIIAYSLEGVVMLPENGVPANVEVLAKDEVFEVLKSDGSISNERIGFRIW